MNPHVTCHLIILMNVGVFANLFSIVELYNEGDHYNNIKMVNIIFSSGMLWI
jgi:hypothetical protein